MLSSSSAGAGVTSLDCAVLLPALSLDGVVSAASFALLPLGSSPPLLAPTPPSARTHFRATTTCIGASAGTIASTTHQACFHRGTSELSTLVMMYAIAVFLVELPMTVSRAPCRLRQGSTWQEL